MYNPDIDARSQWASFVASLTRAQLLRHEDDVFAQSRVGRRHAAYTELEYDGPGLVRRDHSTPLGATRAALLVAGPPRGTSLAYQRLRPHLDALEVTTSPTWTRFAIRCIYERGFFARGAVLSGPVARAVYRSLLGLATNEPVDSARDQLCMPPTSAFLTCWPRENLRLGWVPCEPEIAAACGFPDRHAYMGAQGLPGRADDQGLKWSALRGNVEIAAPGPSDEAPEWVAGALYVPFIDADHSCMERLAPPERFLAPEEACALRAKLVSPDLHGIDHIQQVHAELAPFEAAVSAFDKRIATLRQARRRAESQIRRTMRKLNGDAKRRAQVSAHARHQAERDAAWAESGKKKPGRKPGPHGATTPTETHANGGDAAAPALWQVPFGGTADNDAAVPAAAGTTAPPAQTETGAEEVQLPSGAVVKARRIVRCWGGTVEAPQAPKAYC